MIPPPEIDMLLNQHPDQYNLICDDIDTDVDDDDSDPRNFPMAHSGKSLNIRLTDRILPWSDDEEESDKEISNKEFRSTSRAIPINSLAIKEKRDRSLSPSKNLVPKTPPIGRLSFSYKYKLKFLTVWNTIYILGIFYPCINGIFTMSNALNNIFPFQKII